MKNLKGWRTIGIGLALAVAPSALQYLGAVDWSKLGVGAGVASAISGAIMVAMRYVTNTPPGQSS